MRKIYSLAVLLALMLASTTARAQDADFTSSVTVEYWASNGYASTPVTFALTSVAEKLGMTVQQLVSELETSYPEEEERGDWPDTTIPFSSKMQDGTIYSGSYTADGCGYWMDANGDPCAYDSNGETCKIFDRLTWDEENLIILVGRHPGLSTEGGTYTIFPTLTYGEKTVVFKIDYTYEARPEVVNETTLSKLNILQGTTVTLEQDKRTNYNADNVRVEVPTLLSDLGFASQSELVMQEALYTRVYLHNSISDTYEWTDSVSNESTAGAPGFWFGKTYSYPDGDDEPVEDRTNLASTHDYGTEGLFYAEAFSFVREEGVDYLTFNVGQFPNAASDEGEEYHATVYIVNGTLAYPINIVLTITKTDHSADPNLESYEKAGEIAVLLEGEYDPSYQTIHATIDAAAIAEAMGAETPQDLQLWVRTMADGNELKRKNDGGPSGDISWVDEGIMWINNQGVEVGWNSNAATMISYQMLSNGTYTIGGMDMPGGQFAGEEPYTMSVFLCYPAAQKYYEVIVTRRVSGEERPEKKTMDQWSRVKTYAINCQVIPAPHEGDDAGEHKAGTCELPLDDIIATLNPESTKDLKLYAQRPVEGEEEAYAGEGITFTNSYTCTPYPGFWMAGGQYPSGYGDSDSYGMTLDYNTGVVTIWNKPSTRTVGDNYTSVFYLVDEYTGKYVELVMKVFFVSEIIESEIVGEQDIVIAWEANADGISYGVADLTPAIDGLFEGDASLFESCDWLVEVDGQFIQTSLMDIEWNVFDAEGKYLGNQDDADFGEKYDKSAFTLGFDFTEQAFGVESFIDGGMGWGSTEVVKTNIAMDYNGKRWIFHCYIGDKDTVETGISEIAVKAESKKEVFDLAGRRVSAPVKGLYILNGKKVLVK